MWLLHTRSYKLVQFTLDEAVQTEYAILSHCWETLAGDTVVLREERSWYGRMRERATYPQYDYSPPRTPEPVFSTPGTSEPLAQLPDNTSEHSEYEVTFSDIQDLLRARKKPGWTKVKNTCACARRWGLNWLWDDTCCINKESSAELSEAINSMFTWYRHALVCFVYLGDVPSREDPKAPESLFRKSRWFKRGWTLQELIASDTDAVFLASDWTEIGNCFELAPTLEDITGIDREVLRTWHSQGRIEDVHGMSIAKRISWAAGRKTTRAEDRAYSLMGLFHVHMPIIYGEGGKKAFRRLQHEIMLKSTDHSIFAYGKYATPMQILSLSLDSVPMPQDSLRNSTINVDHTYLRSSCFPSPSPNLFDHDVARRIEPIPVEILPKLLGLTPPAEFHYVPTNQGVRIALPIACMDNSKGIYVALLALRPNRKYEGLVGMLLRSEEDSKTMFRRLARRHIKIMKCSYHSKQQWVENVYTDHEFLVDTSAWGIKLPGDTRELDPSLPLRDPHPKFEMKMIYILP